jgi:hypothetical protein
VRNYANLFVGEIELRPCRDLNISKSGGGW